eukprot:COSAG01_NODE_12022_length_1814_cov_3.041983_2_plen_51_part_00
MQGSRWGLRHNSLLSPPPPAARGVVGPSLAVVEGDGVKKREIVGQFPLCS